MFLSQRNPNTNSCECLLLSPISYFFKRDSSAHALSNKNERASMDWKPRKSLILEYLLLSFDALTPLFCHSGFDTLTFLLWHFVILALNPLLWQSDNLALTPLLCHSCIDTLTILLWHSCSDTLTLLLWHSCSHTSTLLLRHSLTCRRCALDAISFACRICISALCFSLCNCFSFSRCMWMILSYIDACTQYILTQHTHPPTNIHTRKKARAHTHTSKINTPIRINPYSQSPHAHPHTTIHLLSFIHKNHHLLATLNCFVHRRMKSK